MPELLALQRDLAASLRGTGEPVAAGRWIAGDAGQLAQRLAVYRTNVAAAAVRALGAAYPVLRQVVGAQAFDEVAASMQRRTPSMSGDLADHGAGLAETLAGASPWPALPYLPDLARLEWAVHLAYGAADAARWDPATLAQAGAAGKSAALRLRWAAGTAVVASRFPLVRIWQIHQPYHEGGFGVDWNVAECALVAREGLRVEVTALDPGEAAFVICSVGGGTLGASVDAALAADPGFDLGRLLARAIGRGAISGFDLQEDFPHA